MMFFKYFFDGFFLLEVVIYSRIEEQYDTLRRPRLVKVAFQVTPITERYQFDIKRMILLIILSTS